MQNTVPDKKLEHNLKKSNIHEPSVKCRGTVYGGRSAGESAGQQSARVPGWLLGWNWVNARLVKKCRRFESGRYIASGSNGGYKFGLECTPMKTTVFSHRSRLVPREGLGVGGCCWVR